MKLKSFFLSVSMFICTIFQLSADTTTTPPRSLWVWDSAVDLLTDADSQAAFFAFLQAPHGDSNAKITRIFFEARHYNKNKTPFVLKKDYLTGNPAKKLRAFIKAATAQGIQVEYLDGQAIWSETAYVNTPITLCQEVIAYNLASDPDERFSGIHYDIEPHTLGAIWRQNTKGGKDKYNNELENNILSICSSCRSQIQASGLPMTLTLDLPTDYAYYVTDLMNVLLAKTSPLDYITIMNYFDNYDGFVNGDSGIGGVVNNLSLTQIPLVFGIETSPPPYAPVDISFYTQGYTAMETMISEVTQNYGNAPNFAGYGIHHWNSYETLQK